MPQDLSGMIRRYRWSAQIRPILTGLLIVGSIMGPLLYSYVKMNFNSNNTPYSATTQIIALLPRDPDRQEYYPYHASIRLRGFVTVGLSHIPLQPGEIVTARYSLQPRVGLGDTILLEPKTH